MIFKIILEDFLNKLFQELPYIRYNETSFMLIDETFYSNRKIEETPWKEPKNIIMYRATADLSKPNPKQLDFEKDIKVFIDFCKTYFTDNTTFTFSNLKHFLFTGSEKNLTVSELSNWNALENVFTTVNLQHYLQMERKLIRIPCGNLNINIVNFPFHRGSCFCEITPLYESPETSISIKKLQSKMQLKQPAIAASDRVYWTDVWISHLNAVKS